MAEDLEHLAHRVDELQEDVERLEKEANEREKRQLRWGIRALGAVALTLGGYIWSQVGHIFDFHR